LVYDLGPSSPSSSTRERQRTLEAASICARSTASFVSNEPDRLSPVHRSLLMTKSPALSVHVTLHAAPSVSLFESPLSSSKREDYEGTSKFPLFTIEAVGASLISDTFSTFLIALYSHLTSIASEATQAKQQQDELHGAAPGRGGEPNRFPSSTAS
jgi:hypothetical protein